MKLTYRQEIVVNFLSDKMEATAEMVGKAICHDWYEPLSGHAQVGGYTLRNLRKNGLVMRLPELNAWRLTKEGREMVSQSKGE